MLAIKDTQADIRELWHDLEFDRHEALMRLENMYQEEEVD